MCPRCASRHPLEERFCPRCGMPLTYAGVSGIEEPLSPAHERARKIKKQLSEGPLIRVAGARNQAEAELIQGLLLEEGVPSMVQRARGFDVPDMLAAGPRDVLVPRSGAATAREVLLQADMLGDVGRAVERPGRLLLGLLAAIALVALILWIGTDVLA